MEDYPMTGDLQMPHGSTRTLKAARRASRMRLDCVTIVAADCGGQQTATHQPGIGGVVCSILRSGIRP